MSDIVAVGGPMLEPPTTQIWRNLSGEAGAHYSIFGLNRNDDDSNLGMAGLRAMFPDAKANEMNFVLFSTSGVHGHYLTIEDVEASLMKYGDDPDFGDDEPADWCGDTITFLIVHPRIVALRYGNARVTLDDIPFLKKLRASSLAAVATIGTPAAT